MRSWQVALGSDLRAILSAPRSPISIGRESQDAPPICPLFAAGDAQGLPLIELLPAANSGKLHQLSLAGGFVVIAPEVKSIERGAQIRWRPIVR